MWFLLQANNVIAETSAAEIAEWFIAAWKVVGCFCALSLGTAAWFHHKSYNRYAFFNPDYRDSVRTSRFWFLVIAGILFLLALLLKLFAYFVAQ